MRVVVPWRMASARATNALYSQSSRVRARSIFHHSLSKIWTKSSGGFPGMAIPRANAP
jgi:hypothetical protein